ncbi:MAG: hypothetical protein JJT94_16720 [Bernardetiaceae bacterium]|nr:hypothetical protein [Bernardetiaceae bacterium]
MEIILMQSPAQRFQTGINMSELSFQMQKQRIKKNNPAASEREVIVLMFIELYSSQFSDRELEKIVSYLLAT